MSVTKYVASWLANAEDDLKSAEVMLKHNLANPACFHCQQCAEKCLKGFLAFNEKHIRKIHDLPEMLDLCGAIDSSLLELKTDAEYLMGFYIEARYPDDYPQFNLSDAKKAYESALRIKEFVTGKISANKAS